MFTITAEAAAMMDVLEKGKKDSRYKLTVCSSGVGCGGPALKIDMRIPMEDDIVKTVNGVTLHIRSTISENLEGAVIEAVETYWGQRIHVKTTYGCMG